MDMNQKHMLQMLAVCFAVIVIGVAMVSVFGVGANNAVLLGLLILCPLSHFMMMRSMQNQHGSMENNHGSSPREHNNSKSIITTKNEENRNVQNCH